jgi:hypothetical protein
MTENILLIGNGRWGENYISTIKNHFPDVLLQVASRENWKRLINEMPDKVIIATPPQSHIEIAAYALEKNIPVMIEKPLSLSLLEAEELKQYTAPILVNHIHLFSEAYQQLKSIVKVNKIDKIVSLGFNKGPIREYSSLWDYGCHDIAMILDLMNEFPEEVSCEEIKTQTGSLFKINMKFKTLCAESLVGNGAEKSVRKFKVEFGGLKLTYDDKVKSSYHLPPLLNAIKTFLYSKDDYRFGLDLSLKVLKVLELCK